MKLTGEACEHCKEITGHVARMYLYFTLLNKQLLGLKVDNAGLQIELRKLKTELYERNKTNEHKSTQ